MSFAEFVKNQDASPSEEFQKGSVTEQNPDYDLILDEALMAVDNGHVSRESGALVDWGKAHGLSELYAQRLAEEVLTMPKEDETPATGDEEEEGLIYDEDEEVTDDDDDDEETTPMEKSDIQVTVEEVEKEIQEFQKSVTAHGESITTHTNDIEVLGAAVDELIADNKKLGTEVEFLKSEIARIGAAPASEKTPAVGQADLKDPQQTARSRGEVLAAFQKGIAAGRITSDDVLAFESKGIISANVESYMASIPK